MSDVERKEIFEEIIKCEGHGFKDQMQLLALSVNLQKILHLGYGISGEDLLNHKLYQPINADLTKKIEAHTFQLQNCESSEYRAAYFAKHENKNIVSKVHPFIKCIEDTVNDTGKAVQLYFDEVKQNGSVSAERTLASVTSKLNVTVEQVNECAAEHADYFGQPSEIGFIIFVENLGVGEVAPHDLDDTAM